MRHRRVADRQPIRLATKDSRQRRLPTRDDTKRRLGLRYPDRNTSPESHCDKNGKRTLFSHTLHAIYADWM